MISEVSENNGFKCKCQRLHVTGITNSECWCKGIETCSSEEIQHASGGSFQ